jgi:hypothetical protein
VSQPIFPAAGEAPRQAKFARQNCRRVTFAPIRSGSRLLSAPPAPRLFNRQQLASELGVKDLGILGRFEVDGSETGMGMESARKRAQIVTGQARQESASIRSKRLLRRRVFLFRLAGLRNHHRGTVSDPSKSANTKGGTFDWR